MLELIASLTWFCIVIKYDFLIYFSKSKSIEHILKHGNTQYTFKWMLFCETEYALYLTTANWILLEIPMNLQQQS